MDAKSLKHLFDSYPAQNEFYQTADGEVFLTQSAAEAYAARLEDKEIKPLTKDMAVEAKAPAAKTAEATAAKTAPVKAPTGTKKATSKTKETPVKHVVTEGDLDNNPDLAANGLQAGDKIELGEAKA